MAEGEETLEESLIDTDTLRGDIRDRILAEFKHIPNAWQKMAESEQERLISRSLDIAGELVRKAVDLIAERGLPALPIEVGKITIDGATCKGAFECYSDDENLLRIRHLQGKRAMFVLASPDAFNAERKPPETSVVGDLSIPKDGERADEQQLQQVGQGQAA